MGKYTQAFGVLIAANFEAVTLILLAHFGGEYLNETWPVSFNWLTVTWVLCMLTLVYSWVRLYRFIIRSWKEDQPRDPDQS